MTNDFRLFSWWVISLISWLVQKIQMLLQGVTPEGIWWFQWIQHQKFTPSDSLEFQDAVGMVGDGQVGCIDEMTCMVDQSTSTGKIDQIARFYGWKFTIEYWMFSKNKQNLSLILVGIFQPKLCGENWLETSHLFWRRVVYIVQLKCWSC